jgi:hypothetical protein
MNPIEFPVKFLHPKTFIGEFLDKINDPPSRNFLPVTYTQIDATDRNAIEFSQEFEEECLFYFENIGLPVWHIPPFRPQYT